MDGHSRTHARAAAGAARPKELRKRPCRMIPQIWIGKGGLGSARMSPCPGDGRIPSSLRPQGKAAMSDFHKMAMTLLVLWITASTTMTLANAQEPAISEGERRGLAGCLIKCADGDMKCNNRCISRFQTRGAWSDRARACIRSCRNGNQGATQQAADGIFGCSVNCVP